MQPTGIFTIPYKTEDGVSACQKKSKYYQIYYNLYPKNFVTDIMYLYTKTSRYIWI
jgi:hypothetical protein